ncbi:putative cystathionine gamma-synthase [Madurella mycetomatis]|uniref:Cystathionine gamma-synthase n=1 Tax=Madurella mycetomatis TaxID=100816 RepID=A0A175WC46_9PEZI|nr:putative cystathionine gamma-synthase [Madurella mycetomatis]
MSVIAAPELLELGESLPPQDPHGVSVHLPKWADTVGWATREPRVLKEMRTGYPRFFIPRVADRLAMQLLGLHESKIALAREAGGSKSGAQLGLVLSTLRHAQLCRQALCAWNPRQHQISPTDVGVYIVGWEGQITAVEEDGDPPRHPETVSSEAIGTEDIFLVSYPAELALEAKAFWQHTGFGISSRRATHWLRNAPFLSGTTVFPSVDNTEMRNKVRWASSQLKRRIAVGQAARSDGMTLAEDDVFLYQAGMTAIVEIAATIKSLRPPSPDSAYRVAVFGFLYVDTYKVLNRVLGYAPALYKYSAVDIDAFEALLASDPTLRFSALFTEFPGNPLLQSPDLARLHALARKYDFVLVVDDTVGTYANVSVLGSCDIVCTSLTKMFSGGCNVMGGAAVLSPWSPHYREMKASLRQQREEAERAWYWEDVVVMEANSRDFEARVATASANAEAVVAMLRRHGSVREVYYPKGSPTQDIYDRYKLPGGGYGFLLSIRFTSAAEAVVFYDALDVAKGPSLGTNFTLCCAYTLLAHYKELDWAAEYGVVEDLVRISVGLEVRSWLEDRIAKALRATERCEEGSRRAASRTRL